MITPEQYNKSASLLGCDVAAIKAVADIEGSGSGFYKDRPVILYEPHILFRELKKIGIKPPVSHLCYAVQGTYPYPKHQGERWLQLAQASKIDRDAALKSCSWGMFQILGSNFSLCGCHTIQEFVNRMYKSEEEQLSLFVSFIILSGLADELRNHDWEGFARKYNGPGYAGHMYDVKLKEAWEKWSNEKAPR